jgi:hypothetical protein
MRLPGRSAVMTVFAADSPLPAAGLESYVLGMLDNGFSADEVRQMVSANPRGLLET